jgi:4-deoxy-L-threo-5-hexosulose-uronate ketol-isomerase
MNGENMEIRYQQSPKEVRQMDTLGLRKSFLIEQLIHPDLLKMVYTHFDRMIIGGVLPVNQAISLHNDPELKADFFLQRREIGIINTGGPGEVFADGETFQLQKLDCLYLGKGIEQVQFSSINGDQPAAFYLLSAPAHSTYPNQLLKKEAAAPAEMGSPATANHRTIYKYIHADGIKSCQLVMGLTVLSEGSVWNTMPAHTHTRRMEAYFYFDVPAAHRVMHFMGEPSQTRHLVVDNNEAVISPPWSIHAGCGTSSYGFIWGMAGENYTYTDMDPVAISELK